MGDKKLSYEEYIEKGLREADAELKKNPLLYDIDDVLDEMERNIMSSFDKRDKRCIS
ncbi:MAG: hypothetical protein FWD34_04970 [Oscillospiraceae bacterium]|nr:hypothetical protein [Oscillospiraceae bacterium]